MIKRVFQKISHYFQRLGPGFITGAADDDPSGIATYSMTGAQFGYKLTWMTLFLLPLMYSIQEMCGRIGMVSGAGLAGSIKKYYPKKLLYFSVIILFIANTVNIGADLGMMAASLQMILGMPFIFWLILVTVLTVILEIFVPYEGYSRFLKWMGLSVIVYGMTAFIVTRNWFTVFSNLVIPHFEFNSAYIMAIVACLGTTISPYLFFWQTSEQVEEEIKSGKISEFEQSPVIVEKEIKYMRKDTFVGMAFSNLIFLFIVLTTAATLNAEGITNIETAQQAALALKPLAGNFAYLLFTFGIVGIGFQAVPILAGSVAYAISETLGFKEGLAKKLTEAKAFYSIIAISTLVGLLINFIGINPIKALYYAAILNAMVAVPLIAIIIRLADDKRIVGEFKTPKRNKIFAWAGFTFMGIASILLIISLF